MEIQVVEGSGSGGGSGGAAYKLKPTPYHKEDILFCIDIDTESMSEMKNTGPNGRPITRLDSIKQSILLFIHAKLTINPDHRFAFASLSNSAAWVRKEFSSEVDSAIAAFRGLSVSSSGGHADLTQLFRVAAHEAKKSKSQNRILRVILLYCRSSVQPRFQWAANQKLFTLDVIYLHDKPGPENCPQKVYDALVEALEQVTEYEGYIFESGQGLQRILFRHMCLLLSHPQQRCLQDDLGLPMALTKKLPATDSSPGEDAITVISQ
ncbi:hypothetical protein SOVF_045970 [Spinacia oleracea]|uniref:BRISC and BRCA1-A complex member 1 n=1 Tax=Spinacia oleracea TaxID=3562 RepID=A0A9R0JWE8_SPIOL|nr:uncharacterized protein LOC110789256 [Spinacia oleracea]KNA21155.1 hypothetical protein SOVF_045970 [Spinacia oleracea]